MSTHTVMVQQAFKVAVDFTPRQRHGAHSHAGGARFAYNWGIRRIAEAHAARDAERDAGGEPTTPIPGHFDLCKQWVLWRDSSATCSTCRRIITPTTQGGWSAYIGEEPCENPAGHTPQHWCATCRRDITDPTQPPHCARAAEQRCQPRLGLRWILENGSATYQAVLRDAHRAWQEYFASRTGQRAGKPLGRPRRKTKAKSRPAFQTHGGVRLESATKVVLPRLGEVTVMSDDARHPAMVRSRRRAGGQRHMGNRRRSRQLFDQLRHGQRLADRAAAILAILHPDDHPDGDGTLLAILNERADTRARASALARAQERLQKAKNAAAKAKPDKRDKAEARVRAAAEKVARAHAITANRTENYTSRKLAEIRATGALSPVQAADLAEAYRPTHGQLAELAALLNLDQRSTTETLSAWSERVNQAWRVALAESAAQPRVVRATLTLGADGLWWMSLTAETPVQVRTRPSRRQAERGPVGVDLGVRSLATTSQRLGGDANIPNPRHLERAQAELRRAQQELSRRDPNSGRHARAKARVGRIHADVARLRDQHQHRVSTRLARTFTAVGVEGYNLQDLAQGGSEKMPRRLRARRNRALADAALGQLRWQLKYKTERHGGHLVVAEPAAPTGRTCARCGAEKVNPVPPWHERFSCDACGASGPRRVNTALALERMAAGTGSGSPQGGPDGPPQGGPDQSRGGDVRPSGLRPGGRSPAKRAARSRSPGRGQTGTSDP